MADGELRFAVCDEAARRDALTLVLRTVPADQRGPLVSALSRLDQEPLGPLDALVTASEGDRLVAAAWAQPQPGRTAALWRPECDGVSADRVAKPLIELAMRIIDEAGVELTQLLVEDRADPLVADVLGCGFRYIAELQYLGCDIDAPIQDEETPPLELVESSRLERRRLEKLVTQTYTDTLDCPELEGLRSIREVLKGYEQTGDHDPADWFVLRQADRDVGVLLLSEHRASQQMELIYVGVVPAARGRRIGHAAVAAAKRIAANRRVDRLVLAVDTRNRPAREIYRAAGFDAWTSRHALARPRGAS